jgi:hypothetical protein
MLATVGVGQEVNRGDDEFQSLICLCRFQKTIGSEFHI